MNLSELDYGSQRSLLSKGEVNCGELVEQYLNNIEQNQNLNAFVSVFPERARETAVRVDDKFRAGQAGKLAGMVVALKDILALKNEQLTCGSRILQGFVAPYTATTVQRLLDEDAIIIGKTNMDEFGMGSSNENSSFGPVRNPSDTERTPGGSSGGSAAAVSAGMAAVAMGSDTGGSVRQPAAMCGVVGLKPSYGRVSRYGLVAFASSLDQVGPIARSVKDTARVLSVIAGHDHRDSTSARKEVPDYLGNIDDGVDGLSIGCPKEFLGEALAPDVLSAVQDGIRLLEEGGARIEEVSLPHSEYAIATYYILATAEASANLARYDGVRYGFRADRYHDLTEMYEETRSQGFGDEVKRRIMLGTYVLSAGYYDAYYRKAQKVRTLIKQDFDRVFDRYDCLIAPTSPNTAFKLGEKIDNPLQMYLSDVHTNSANLAGINGISIPFGLDSGSLPIGVQLLSQAFNETTTLRVARYLEDSLKKRDGT